MQSTNLWSAGKSTLTCYSSQNASVVDKFFYICEEEINDMLIVLRDAKAESYLTVLACSDSALRVVDDRGKLMIDQKLGSPVNCISLNEFEGSFKQTLVAYGLQNGNFGVVEVATEDIIVLWECEASELGAEKRAPVSLI